MGLAIRELQISFRGNDFVAWERPGWRVRMGLRTLRNRDGLRDWRRAGGTPALPEAGATRLCRSEVQPR
jgi:hypothetical protein